MPYKLIDPSWHLLLATGYRHFEGNLAAWEPQAKHPSMQFHIQIKVLSGPEGDTGEGGGALLKTGRLKRNTWGQFQLQLAVCFCFGCCCCCRFDTYQDTILRFIAFRFQFDHILDQDFCVATQYGLDALCKQKEEEGRELKESISNGG